jgi:hypothetical protein
LAQATRLPDNALAGREQDEAVVVAVGDEEVAGERAGANERESKRRDTVAWMHTRVGVPAGGRTAGTRLRRPLRASAPCRDGQGENGENPGNATQHKRRIGVACASLSVYLP